MWISLWSPAVLSQQAFPCTSEAIASAQVLSCVAGYLVDADNKTAPPDWVKTLLRKLAQKNGYDGSSSDLAVLKQQSARLKRDPNANREVISLLDRAIASYVDEIGPAVSTERLAKASDLGADIYPKFIEQKLKFLSSERARFYDGGPFEIAWRSLLVGSLESEYFLQENPDKLRRAIQVLDEILIRRRGPDSQYGYLANRMGPLLNGDRFWRASLLFVLGEKAEAQKELRSLIWDNQHFGVEVAIPPGAGSSRHVYIYRIFNFPHQIIVQADNRTEGSRKVEAKDSNVVDRYYNAAQIALSACAHLDDAGTQKGIKALTAEIQNLELNDYYVIAGSADTSAQARELAASLNQQLSSTAVSTKRDQLVGQFAKESQRFAETMSRGASRCGISNDVRDQIYSSFDFRVLTASISGFGKANEYLVLGGRLNAEQANTVAEFLNRAVLPETRNLIGKDAGGAYVARMKIAQ